MPVNWECGECAAHHEAKAAANISGEFDHTVKEWDEYTDLREALIWSLLSVKFPDDWKITEKNWEEIYRRLYILEKATGCRRIYGGRDGDVEVYFTPEEVHSMIGLSVNAGNLTTAKFKTYIYKELTDSADWELKRFHREQELE